jgi:murein DD-endopeptidase MepM/ murein hydrolase activator NlpD
VSTVPKPSQSRAGNVYRGRRRLPKLPSRRYAAVVVSAIMGATVVALGSTTVIPDDLTAKHDDQSLLAVTDWFDRTGQEGQEDYVPAVSVDSDRPDVWLLPLRYPYQITSLFGPRWGRIHWGTDLAAPTGVPIYAVHEGIVKDASYESGFGLHVMIDHGDGVTIYYAHASVLLVGAGTHVKAGDMIARVGSTGNSTGPHLHFEVRVHDGFYDAQKFMREHGVDLRTRQEEANGGVIP